MKKIFGALLIILGCFLSLAIIIVTLPLILKNIGAAPKGVYSMGYLFGLIIGFLLFATLNAAFYFFGFKLLKNKKKEIIPILDEDFPSKLK